jgi:hypothetical protein
LLRLVGEFGLGQEPVFDSGPIPRITLAVEEAVVRAETNSFFYWLANIGLHGFVLSVTLVAFEMLG